MVQTMINEAVTAIKENRMDDALNIISQAQDAGAECMESECDTCKLVEVAKELNVPIGTYLDYPTCDDLVRYLGEK